MTSEDIKITKHQLDDGTQFFIGMVDGVKYTTFSGVGWLGPRGEPPAGISKLREAFRDYLLEGAGQTTDEQSPLSDNELEALRGAIRDAEAGLRPVIYPVDQEWYIKNVPPAFKFTSKPDGGTIILFSDTGTPSMKGTAKRTEDTSYDVSWCTKTGRRNVICPSAVAEIEGLTGPIKEWTRGMAYQTKNGDFTVLLHPEDAERDYFFMGEVPRKLTMTFADLRYYPVPGSTGRLYVKPEIEEDR